MLFICLLKPYNLSNIFFFMPRDILMIVDKILSDETSAFEAQKIPKSCPCHFTLVFLYFGFTRSWMDGQYTPET